MQISYSKKFGKFVDKRQPVTEAFFSKSCKKDANLLKRARYGYFLWNY